MLNKNRPIIGELVELLNIKNKEAVEFFKYLNEIANAMLSKPRKIDKAVLILTRIFSDFEFKFKIDNGSIISV